ncbi:protein kinase family protein [Pseudalkalibacillus caeni]|uniref:Protein kinase family protein n=1 Tax=Exobacillus caeni TaxID=2574798 RepID=A0A5R9F2H7_9BACL|nr:protein kinase family protein [Pseudalkalibacillus caeni]TLS37291.1 protein kinase family protein [Pseudalkalibacillus caeni]
MERAKELAGDVAFADHPSFIKITNIPEGLKLIGKGRSACVFKIRHTKLAMKIFLPEYESLAIREANIYKRLKGTGYFPELYEAGKGFLVMDYIEGKTFYDCVNEGIRINETMIDEVDQALNIARQKGLNPSDIHLRNLLLTKEGTIKVIDVVRYEQTKKCRQWDDLKLAYYKYYSRKYFPKRLPKPLLETIAVMYKKKLFTI